MMHMTFYWGKSVTILFDSWKTDSWLSYSLSLIACFIFSIFYQYMEDRRIRIRLLSNKPPPATSQINVPLLNWKPDSRNRRCAAAILFVINSAIGYLLMLAIMSFNGGVFVAIVLGLGVGYFVFRGRDGEIVLVDDPCACA